METYYTHHIFKALDIQEAEVKFKDAFKIAETNYRRSQQLQHQNQLMESQHRRDTNVMIYIRRRLAMCARKLGRLKEAVKMFKVRWLFSEMNKCSVLRYEHGSELSDLLGNNYRPTDQMTDMRGHRLVTLPTNTL